MENLVNQIESSYNAFITDAKSQVAKGNKAAGARARKVSLEIEKLLKEFRKKSIEETKN
ncbi:MAG: histone H1 [Tannerella sp.]|jgi:hypothetical protein|nr:histone H1 [Tannerella sp.]